MADYEAREKSEVDNFIRRFRQGKFGLGDRYPSASRLKLYKPYTKSIEAEKIWSQIPLHGTTIIVLKPTRKEIFEKVHGFDTEDIDRLIDFAKETKRIQFSLDEYPTYYKEMDFLEPIFRELTPPKLMHIPLYCIEPVEKIKKSYNQIKCLLENPQSIDFIKKYIEKKYYESTISQDDVKEAIVHDLIRLRLLGYENLVKDFTRWLTTVEPAKYILLLQAVHDIFLFPYDPLKGIKSFKRPDIRELQERFALSSNVHEEMELPCEVGKFLNDKLKLITPKNCDGAIELSDRYDLYDLRKVANVLNEAVEKKKIDVINEKSKEISVILENVWSDADKLKACVRYTRFGISFGIAITGFVATLPIAGIGGLLAGLGFQVADKIAEIKAYESISEKIVKWRTQSHIIHVYDFKKRYKLS